MYNEQIEVLISAALADGMLTEKEKQILFKKAQAQGIDLDEFEMVLDARLVELEKAEKEKAAASAPKSTKYGDVRKCPVCGAMVPALAGTCPECGYEFSGVDANLSSKQLADQLLKTYGITKKREIIETFPIPNTKADLFEFITTLLPKISDRQLGKTYRAKLEECILKASTLFPNDPTFVKITAQAQHDIKKHKQRKLIIILSIVCVVVLGGGIPTIWGVTHSKAYNQRKINEYLNQGLPEKAVKYCMRNYRGSYHNQLRVSVALANAGRVDDAIRLYLVHYNKKDLGDCWQTPSPDAIRKALIREKRYDEALEFTNNKSYGTTIIWIIEDYCKEGKKQEAHSFLRTHSLNCIDRDDDLHEKYKSNNIDREIRKFIDNY